MEHQDKAPSNECSPSCILSLAPDRVSLCIVTSTVIVILLIVIAGVIARFVLEEQASRIVLICLICLLCVLGVGALTMLEMRRRRSTRKRKQALRDKRYCLRQSCKLYAVF
nr:unnamed protein product [Callosobruchus analis]